MMSKIIVDGHGALPFINGLSSGYAAAMGIDLPIVIEAEVTPDPESVEFLVVGLSLIHI